MARCKTCNVPVYWVTTVTGKKMLMDEATNEPHWFTCTDPKKYRKRYKKEDKEKQLDLFGMSTEED